MPPNVFLKFFSEAPLNNFVPLFVYWLNGVLGLSISGGICLSGILPSECHLRTGGDLTYRYAAAPFAPSLASKNTVLLRMSQH